MKNDTQTQPSPEHNKLLLSWKTPEFINHPRSKTWFLVAGTLVIALVAYALYTDSATMAIVFIVLAGVYYLTHNQEPKLIDIAITELGIYVADKFYPYNMINSFWVVYNPPFVQTLNLKLGNKSSTRVTVQLNMQNPVEVRALLAREIPEVEGEEESMVDLFIRMLRL